MWIVESAHFLMIQACVLALLQSIPAFYPKIYPQDWLKRLCLLQFFCLLAAFGGLIYAFLGHDFSVALVALHSHTRQPLLYQFAAAWSNHEGSMILWCLIMSLGTLILSFHRTFLDYHQRAIGVQGLLIFGFSLYALTVSNPFRRLFPPPFEGEGLNPLLQDPSVAIHPPGLYLGFVGVSIIFSLSLAYLLSPIKENQLAKSLKPWVMICWIFLTFGILMGSRWAYVELGWGGYWFWDPVENASLMPWLVLTSLLHSLHTLKAKGGNSGLVVFLGILTFSMSLIGTFLVRSGLLISVHSFAADPQRGYMLLGMIFILLLLSFGVYFLKGQATDRLQAHRLSRPSMILYFHMILMVILGVVFLGTIYPMILEAITSYRLSIGAPYFNKTVVPLFLVIGGLMILIPWQNWQGKMAKNSMQILRYILAAVIFGLLVFICLFPVVYALAFAVGIGLIASHLLGKKQSLSMTLAHIGFGIMMIAIALSALLKQERLVMLKTGEDAVLGHYQMHFTQENALQGQNYQAIQAHMTITGPNGRIVTLVPEKRFFPRMITSEVALDKGLWRDMYLVMGEQQNGRWLFHWMIYPFILWIWLGGLVMILGGFLGLLKYWRK